MPKKIGGGNKLQEYKKKDGEYTFNDGGETTTELSNRLKQEIKSEPYTVKKIDKNNHKQIFSQLQNYFIDEFVLENQTLKHENASIYDKNGQRIYEKKGNSSQVGFYPWEYKKFVGQNLIHNHPQGNTFLSVDDVYKLNDWKLESISAIGYDGWQHTIKVDDSNKKDNKNLLSFIKEYDNVLKKGVQEATELYRSLPKKSVKARSYVYKIPEDWETYRKGAGISDMMNYPKYAEIIQRNIMDFSKTSKEKYGIISIFEKR